MIDEVEDILAAWQTERPDLDVTPMAVLSRISRLAAILAERRLGVFRSHGLLPYEFDVLAALRRAGDPYELTAGALVAATHVTSGTMTNRVNRLVEKKWVKRRADTGDGRIVRVRLAGSGKRKVDAALTALLVSEQEMLTGLSGNAQLKLAAQLRQLTVALD